MSGGGMRNFIQPASKPENICLFMHSCLTFGNSRILAETLVVVGHEGKMEKEEDEEAEEEEEEDEGKVQVEPCVQHLQCTLDTQGLACSILGCTEAKLLYFFM